LGTAGAKRGQWRQGACTGVDIVGAAACSTRGKLRRDAGECIGGKVGEGAFLEEGQDSCGGLACPPGGRTCALGSPAERWFLACAHFVWRLLERSPWCSWGRLETCSGHAVCEGGFSEAVGALGRNRDDSSCTHVLGEVAANGHIASLVCAGSWRAAREAPALCPAGSAALGFSSFAVVAAFAPTAPPRGTASCGPGARWACVHW
jgi:hypothetical protein